MNSYPESHVQAVIAKFEELNASSRSLGSTSKPVYQDPMPVRCHSPCPTTTTVSSASTSSNERWIEGINRKDVLISPAQRQSTQKMGDGRSLADRMLETWSYHGEEDYDDCVMPRDSNRNESIKSDESLASRMLSTWSIHEDEDIPTMEDSLHMSMNSSFRVPTSFKSTVESISEITYHHDDFVTEESSICFKKPYEVDFGSCTTKSHTRETAEVSTKKPYELTFRGKTRPPRSPVRATAKKPYEIDFTSPVPELQSPAKKNTRKPYELNFVSPVSQTTTSEVPSSGPPMLSPEPKKIRKATPSGLTVPFSAPERSLDRSLLPSYTSQERAIARARRKPKVTLPESSISLKDRLQAFNL